MDNFSNNLRRKGCNWGRPQEAYEYVMTVGGQDTEQSYPYNNGTKGKCRFNRQNTDIGAKNIRFGNIAAENEYALKYAVYKQVRSDQVLLKQNLILWLSPGSLQCGDRLL